MAKKDKKSLSIKAIIIITLLSIIVVLTVYFVPFLLADANSRGWYETGRYAHANLYPQLAIDSYNEALRRFPDPRAFPQGRAVEPAKNLLFSLKQGLSGLPFRSIYDNLVKNDFKGLKQLLDSGALSVQKLEIDRLDAAGKTAMVADLEAITTYVSKITAFQDEQDRPRYSGNFSYIELADLKQQLKDMFGLLKKTFVESDIFIKEDFSRIDDIFATDLKLVDALTVGNLNAVKADLRSRIKSLPMLVKQLLNRKHIEFFKQVDVQIEALKGKTELLKKMLGQAMHDRIWNAEFGKFRDAGGGDKLDKGQLEAVYAKFAKAAGDARKLIGEVGRDIRKLDQHLKSEGRKGIELPQAAQYEGMLADPDFQIPDFARFEQQARIYATKMHEIKTKMQQAQKDRDDAQSKKFSAQGAARAALEARQQAMAKLFNEQRTAFEAGLFLPMFAAKRSAFADANASFIGSLEMYKKPYSNAAGEVTAHRRIEELCKEPVLNFDSRFMRIQLSIDKKFMLLNEDPRSAEDMREGIDAMFDRIFKQFLAKTIAFIETSLKEGKVKELQDFLDRSGYFKHLDSKYREDNSWRIEFVEHGNARAESVLKKILNFAYFYNKNGVLGDRSETLLLNRKYLVPLAIKLIEDGGLVSKHKDLLDDLKLVPKHQDAGSEQK